MLLAAAASGAVLVLARQATYGVGLHWDSGVYLAVARNLLDGAGFRDYGRGVYVAWPPLYPLALAVFSLDVLDPLAVAGPVNAALFALTIFVVGRYLRRRLESRFLVVWATLAIALAWPLAGLAAYALTGAAFILLVTLTLIDTDAFLAKGRTSALVRAGVWAALAWQTRFVGAALPAAVAVMVLLQRGARPAQRVRRAAGFALLAGAPMALWLVRNRLVAGTPTGTRGQGMLSWPATLSGIGEVLRSWAALDFPLIERQAIASLGLLAAAALAAACGVLIRERWRRRRMPSEWLPCYVFGGFALAHVTSVTAALLLGATFHGVQERHLAPLYVPLLLCAAFALDRVLGFAPRRRRFRRLWKRRWTMPRAQAAAAVVTAVLAIWTAGQIEPNVREIRRANSRGSDYASPFWARSETLEWSRRNQMEGRILSNEALVVSIHNYARAVRDQEYRYLPGVEEDMVALLQGWHAAGDTYYVVWFDDEWVTRRLDYGIAALRATPGLEPVAELADGTVFRAGPADKTMPADR